MKSAWESKLDEKLLRKFSVRLMNDTKWREVWSLIVQHSLRVSMSYATDQEWYSEFLWGPFTEDYVWEKGIRDPGIGGPFLYKEILSIRIPKKNQNTPAFLEDAVSIGQLPINETEEEIEIIAYK